jgi:5'-nucleotidase
MDSSLGTAYVTILLSLLLTLGCASGGEREQDASGAWPSVVLITNDNGIDDRATIALAVAFAQVAETYVVAPAEDRSGGSNFMPATRAGQFDVERRDLGSDIRAYALEGYPADCVVFALAGPMRDRPPDLVISGINGGPNLADDWLGSGTIGAARTAAYLGVPAIAVSGVEDDDPQSVAAAVSWVVALAQSPAVRSLRAPQYLTVSLPVLPQAQIEGIEIVHRARGLIDGVALPAPGGDSTEGTTTWELELNIDPSVAGDRTDVRAVQNRRIAIVAMRVDEHDANLEQFLRRHLTDLPSWPRGETIETPAAARGSAPESDSACDRGLGVSIDDVKDERGREWGVVVEEVVAGSRAEAIGLKAGDIIVRFNGLELSNEAPQNLAAARAGEDPDDRFARLLRQLACGDTVRLEYVRGGDSRIAAWALGVEEASRE